MGTYTGSSGDDEIRPGGISAGVLAEPLGTTPGRGDDILIGKGGNDSLFAGAGHDGLQGGRGADRVAGGKGDDSLSGGEGDDRLLGGEGDDRLEDNDGENLLIGGPGNDSFRGSGNNTLRGGAGDDFYSVDEQGVTVIEDTDDASGGVDEVVSFFSYTLGFGLENLRLADPSEDAFDATGNALNNRLEGNTNRNVLRGGGGDDRLFGDWGNDELWGGGGHDVLRGGMHQDRLRGGGGDDTFVFAARKESGDAILGFGDTSGNDDQIAISASGFGGGLVAGTLSAEQFQTSAGHEAQSADVRLIFDTTDTTLWFDKNGDAEGGLKRVADLQDGATLQANDIFLV